jgi:hypothetical protein
LRHERFFDERHDEFAVAVDGKHAVKLRLAENSQFDHIVRPEQVIAPHGHRAVGDVRPGRGGLRLGRDGLRLRSLRLRSLRGGLLRLLRLQRQGEGRADEGEQQ